MPEANYQLDHLSREFLAQLRRVLPERAFRTEFTDRLIVTIPARATEVGDITVWLDGGEVTVGIGQLHHSHFETCTQSALTLEERERVAAEMAANYIRDIIEERVRFSVQFAAGRCLGSTSWYPEHSEGGRPPSRGDEIREYVWSRQLK
jgi:hypothetical protein